MSRLRFIIAPLVVLALVGFQVASADVPDSTAVRKLYPPKKSVSEILLYVPSKILQIPVHMIREGAKPFVKGISIPDEVKKFPATVFDSDNLIIPVGSAGSRSGFSGGLSFNFRNLVSTHDRMRFIFTYSTTDYQKYTFNYRAPGMLSPTTGLSLFASYRDRTQERFVGLRQLDLLPEEVSYRLEQSKLGASVYTRISSSLSLSISGEFTKSQVFDGENPNVESRLDSIISSLVNLSKTDTRPTRIWSISAELRYDSRNHPGQPSAGGLHLLQTTYNRGPQGPGNVEFISSRVDIRRYINIYDRRILALRLLVQDIYQPGARAPTPFYLLNRLGGQHNLRGFKSDRFTDNDLALVSVEYRYPIWDSIDAFLLIDAGRVFDQIEDDFRLRYWEWNYVFV
ncbi:MAG: BamA/TamA family outer membrane protein, partial [candidate division Zixibacteria bacterium]|nr:BamA/TamA family outer membrane protein [candidate division Zixibacteria bacterium]